jgi:hypothetical protein
MNGIAEAVRQIGGTAVGRVPGARRVVLVTAGTGVPASGPGPERRPPGVNPQ